MPRRLIITVVCFHITAALLVLFAIAAILAGALMWGPMSALLSNLLHSSQGKAADGAAVVGMVGVTAHFIRIMIFAMAALSLALAVGLEIVIVALRRLRYWAWIVGIVICGLLIIGSPGSHLVSLVLGGLALWGLVDPESVAAFRPSAVADAPESTDNDKQPG